MPKKGGRKPSARKMQSHVALSRVKHEPNAWTVPPAVKSAEVSAGTIGEPEPEQEPRPEPEPELGSGNSSDRADELELIRAMFEEELCIPSPDDPYTFSLQLSVPDSAQPLRSWMAALVLEVTLPTQGYPQSTQLRVRCSRCDKRALRSLHRSLALALAEDHSVADGGPRVCFAAQWLAEHAHRFFNVAETVRSQSQRSSAREAAVDPVSSPSSEWSEDDSEEEAEVGGGSVVHGVDLCFCIFESLRPSLPVPVLETWLDENGRLRRGAKHFSAADNSDSSPSAGTAPVGKMLAQWARKKYFVGLLCRGAPAVVVLQTNVAPEYVRMSVPSCHHPSLAAYEQLLHYTSHVIGSYRSWPELLVSTDESTHLFVAPSCADYDKQASKPRYSTCENVDETCV